ncbi:MAG: HDIG domain-containing protein [Thermotogaceae bacterium]|nr:HDIG domain-containing protein [Thermotogaceae bacterium]
MNQFLTPILTVIFLNLLLPSSWKAFLIELIFAMLLWHLFIQESFRSNIFKLHKSFSITFNSIVIASVLSTALIINKFGNVLSTIYLFTALAILLFGEKSAKNLGFFISILMFIHFQEDIWIFLYGALMTLVVVKTLKTVYRRSDVMKSAGIAAIAGVIFIFLKWILTGIAGKFEMPLIALNPFISSVIVLGILPYIEYTSRIYSNIGLMELGNLNHPLLKLLSIRAPGTYQHSSMVANLAEAAAEKIGANSLLARVSAYYHDIGKIKRPAFFVENQIGIENPHDNISPYLSHLILDEHVKYGIHLAKKNRLPILIESVIAEHHGTRVQKYFYEKAKKLNPSVSEDDFRYPGLKPRFKESGIIMLADSVEAVSRTFSGNKSPAQIQAAVEETVMGIFTERQLENSGLTLEDIELLIEEFARVVTSSYHKRIEYPKKGEEGVIDGDNKSNKI